MNPIIIPVGCGLAVASMSSAMFSHWWSVRELTNGKSLVPPPALVTAGSPVLNPARALADNRQGAAPVASPEVAPGKSENTSALQKELFQSMLDEIKKIRKENSALREQMAETNSELMKLEFRVDTHSASFRPLPTTETESELRTPLEDEEPGVLPPQLDVPPNLGGGALPGGM